MKKLFREYLSILKPLPIEGVPDIIFFRPIAFVLVKLLYRFPVTPNQLSAFAMITGIGAGICYATGTQQGLVSGSVLYLGTIVLDCADGMLARLKNKGTPLGRVIDGIVDYVNGIAIFSGLAVGLTRMPGHYILPAWILVLIAGVSMILHSTLIDYYRQQFYIHALGIRQSSQAEITGLPADSTKLRRGKRQYLKKLIICLYLYYCRFQRINSHRERHFDANEYYRVNVYLLRLWLMIEQSLRVVILTVATFIGRPEIFLFYIIVLANAWVLIMLPVQKIVDRRIELRGAGRQLHSR
jgi:phosphatidylglycerophosphate synthase